MNSGPITKSCLALFFASIAFQLNAAELVADSTTVETATVEKNIKIRTKPGLSELLGGMGAALNSGSYQLSMVYVHDDQIDSLRLSHLSTQDDQYDKLEHLQGAQRVVVTHNGETWLYMGQEKVHISSEEESPVIRWRRQLERLARNIAQYNVFISAVNRVAGRLAYQINFISKDKQRHSSRLWIDVDNFLPMRLDSLDVQGKTIEQILTINLNYPANITKSDFEFGENFRLIDSRPVVLDSEQGDLQSLWEINWLPIGFELSSLEKRSENKIDYEQWIYTDGLSTLSVFIESVEPVKKQIKKSFLRGDAIIFDMIIDNKRVTVVGNIPIKTAERIALSVTVKALQKTQLNPTE